MAAETLEQAHVLLNKRVLCALQIGAVPFVVGGGNDQSYANASALMQFMTDTGGNPRAKYALATTSTATAPTAASPAASATASTASA